MKGSPYIYLGDAAQRMMTSDSCVEFSALIELKLKNAQITEGNEIEPKLYFFWTLFKAGGYVPWNVQYDGYVSTNGHWWWICFHERILAVDMFPATEVSYN